MSDSVRPHRRQPTRLPDVSSAATRNTGLHEACPGTLTSFPPIPEQESKGKNDKELYELELYKVKRHLLLGRKVRTNLDSILKSRDITLPTKVRLVKAVSSNEDTVVSAGNPHWIFPVRMASDWSLSLPLPPYTIFLPFSLPHTQNSKICLKLAMHYSLTICILLPLNSESLCQFIF